MIIDLPVEKIECRLHDMCYGIEVECVVSTHDVSMNCNDNIYKAEYRYIPVASSASAARCCLPYRLLWVITWPLEMIRVVEIEIDIPILLI